MTRAHLVVALDLQTPADALRVARRLRGVVDIVKVGSVLFTQAGPEVIRRLRTMGFEVMLDLKWFDIPSTVAAATAAAVGHRVRLVTVHAAAGRAVLRAAVQAARREARSLRVRRPLVVAVTVLTSVGGRDTARRTLAFARDAVASGCDGVVASAREARAIRRSVKRSFAVVCPGIRVATASSKDDQRRVASPGAAVRVGASHLVVGRPITGAADPRVAARAILQKMMEASSCR